MSAYTESRIPAVWSSNAERLFNPGSLVGRKYELNVTHGSHSTSLIGTILALQQSDEVGVELYISNPEFWGGRIRSLVHDHADEWSIRTDDPEERVRVQLVLIE